MKVTKIAQEQPGVGEKGFQVTRVDIMRCTKAIPLSVAGSVESKYEVEDVLCLGRCLPQADSRAVPACS